MAIGGTYVTRCIHCTVITIVFITGLCVGVLYTRSAADRDFVKLQRFRSVAQSQIVDASTTRGSIPTAKSIVTQRLISTTVNSENSSDMTNTQPDPQIESRLPIAPAVRLSLDDNANDIDFRDSEQPIEIADVSGRIPYNNTRTMCVGQEKMDNTITFIVQNPRTGSLYMSGRLQQYSSGQFEYKWVRVKQLSPKPFGVKATVSDWLQHACKRIPGYKVVVYDSGATPNWWLKNWPSDTILIMTGDEMGRWGLYYRGRYWGPFGDDKEQYFYKNETSSYKHILLPPTIRPWFRQYYDKKQVETFGHETIFVPLGSRVEFPDIPLDKIKLPHDRQFIISVMMAMTDNSRQQLVDVINATDSWPKNRSYLHIASQWHPEVTNKEYVNPTIYADTMMESIFTPCPKGRSMDTFRLYEAIEAGSIPILELANGYARDHLPPEYFDSPIVFVESWQDLPQKIAQLLLDPKALARRQANLRQWYSDYMKEIVGKMEDLLLQRHDRYRS